MATAGGSTGSGETRERILDAAEALFARNGLAGTPVRDIARAVELTPASLYNHFDGKQAIYDAVLERGVGPLLALLTELAARDHTPRDMDEMIGSIMAALSERPHLPRLIQHEVIGGGPHLGTLARNWIRPLLELGIAELKRDDTGVWCEEEYRLVMAAWLNMVFGHFAMAPALAEAFDDDPLSAPNLSRQTRFLRKLARLMMAGRTLLAEEGEPT